MGVRIRVVTSDEDLEEAARIDLMSFGHVLDREAFGETLPWRRSTTNYLAELEGASVGTARVYDFELTVPGGATVGVSGIGDLGVLTSHRRRGVLAALMARTLDDAAARGHLAAALYASEATIYGRFGFAPATRSKQVRIAAARTALRHDVRVAAGSVRVLDPPERAEVLAAVHERARTRRPGEVARSPQLWSKVLGLPRGSSRDERFCLAHLGADGSPAAYALYTVTPAWAPDGPHHRLSVLELVAIDDASELAMWEALFSVDLVETIEGWVVADSPLLDALADRWALCTIGEHDTLWIRLIDVPAALAARRYRVPGRLVLQVRDEAGSRTGDTLVVEAADDGTATVETADGGPDLRLGVEELGSVWLGGGSLAGLVAVGRVEEVRPGALARADAMLGWAPSPRITHEF